MRTMAGTLVTALIAVPLAVPDPAAGQSLARADRHSAASPTLDRTTSRHLADLLEAWAARHATTRAGFLEAAVLYRESARLRAPENARNDPSFLLSARLFTHAGHPRRAIAVLEERAHRCLEADRPLSAARAYLEAGMIAQAHGDEAAAHRLGRRALDVAVHGGLTPEEWESILDRVVFVED